MKRFLVFTFGDFYPCGGFEDYLGSWDTLKEAKERAFETRNQYKQIFDTKESRLYEFERGEWTDRCILA